MENSKINEKQFSKEKRTVYSQIIIIATLVSLLSSLLIYKIAFHNAYVLKGSIFGIDLPLPTKMIVGIFAGSFLLSVSLILFFAKKGIIKRLGEGSQDYVSDKMDNDFKALFQTSNSKPVAMIFLIIAIATILFCGINNFGFYKDYCKFSDSHSIVVHKVAYSDLTLYRVKGWFDNATHLYNEDEKAYVIVSDDGKSYDFGVVSDELEQVLFSHFGRNYKEAETLDDVLAEQNK